MRGHTDDAAPGDPIAGDRRPVPISTPWVLLLAVPIAVIVAAAISAQTYLSMLGHGHSFAGIFAWQLSSWLAWALASPIVLRVGGQLAERPRPAIPEPRRRWPVWRRVLGLGVVLIAAHVVLVSQLTLWFQPYVPVTASGYWQALVLQLGSLLPVDLIAYATVVLAGVAMAVYYRARALEVLDSQLHADLARAQLDALRLEIQPHFLFNTLNAISALIRAKSNDRALDMLVGLGELMRETLDRTTSPVVTLDRELDLTRRYVELQQARFGDRLAVQYAIAPECLAHGVPTFVLQPLVENALRHGMGRDRRRLLLEIGARLEERGGRLHVWIADDGAGLPPGFALDRDAGTGLGNTRARLQRLHGAAARLAVETRPGGGVVARVVLPATAPADLVEATA